MPSAFFGRPSDGAAVVVGENDDRHVFQRGVEHPLAGAVERVTIDKRDASIHRARRLGLIEPETTPQTSTTASEASPNSG